LIRRIHLTNYRSHDSTDVRLEPLSLMVGPAGTGKSNLLKALVFVQNTVHRPIAELFPPASPFEFRSVRSRWADETAPMGFELEFAGIEGGDARYVLRFADSPQGIYVLEETLARRTGQQDWQWVFQRRWPGKAELGEFGSFSPYEPTVLNRTWYGSRPNDSRDGVRFARAVAKQMWSTGYHHLETSWLREPGDDRDIERLGYSGKDLPGFIAHLQRADSQRFDAILSSMRELLPHLDRIIVNRVGPDRQGLAMTFKDQRGYVNSPDLSDGTLFTLGLLAITRADKLPRLLCIEEPETGLHPRRLRWLFDRFVELAYPNDGQAEAVQVILTSHSPHLVDLFKDMQASVSVVEQDNGRTKITSLLDVKKKLREGDRGDPIGHEWATGLFEGL
jgi:predicted ATPase